MRSRSGTERERALARLAAASKSHHRTAEDKVAAVIRDAIASGIFRPGERLPQDMLARLLDVSRMPIRSAMGRLESEGLVEVHPHRGASVRALSAEEVSDLYEMRILIETFALRKTTAAISTEHFERLEALSNKLESDTTSESELVSRQAFYRYLYGIGNTPRVVTTIMQFRAEVSRYTLGLVDLRSRTHRELLERIRLGNPDLAASWLEAHLREVAQEMKRQLEDPAQ
jgi:DNA-binding GntR family transcriptional regulator